MTDIKDNNNNGFQTRVSFEDGKFTNVEEARDYLHNICGIPTKELEGKSFEELEQMYQEFKKQEERLQQGKE